MEGGWERKRNGGRGRARGLAMIEKTIDMK